MSEGCFICEVVVSYLSTTKTTVLLVNVEHFALVIPQEETDAVLPNLISGNV